jgi:hypothetical protein
MKLGRQNHRACGTTRAKADVGYETHPIGPDRRDLFFLLFFGGCLE